jgi:hypothetical protein
MEFPGPPPPAAAAGTSTTALALVPSGPPSTGARQERSVAIVTSKEIDEMHGDEISRRLAEFGKSAPTGIYSKPRGK